MTARHIVKRSIQGIALVLTFPAALTCALGRIRSIYTIWAHSYALIPGIPGNFLRAAFYSLTLRECSIDTTISWGTFFVYPEAFVGENVSVGGYCVIGRARIGAGTQIASHVQITSGRHQHQRDAGGELGEAALGEVAIGARCWIGASAVVMASVGEGATIGAGSVVVREIPAHVVAAGNPARVIRALEEAL